jgi:hypothetical protein
MYDEKLDAIGKAATQQKYQEQAGAFMGGACRVGLRERVARQMERAMEESGKFSRLSELSELLNRNPEVARILDLIEEVRG